MADETIAYQTTGLIGGGGNDLDGVDGRVLKDKDFAYIMLSGNIQYNYMLDAASGQAEKVPFIIKPDVNAGNKRWILQTPYVAYVDATAPDQGAATAEGYRSLKDLIDKIGLTKKATIVCSPTGSGDETTYTLTTNETVPTNITLKMENGAILDGAGTLTINRPFEHGNSQCFGSSIIILFGYGSIDYLRPEWWATNTTPGTTDMHVAFEKAVACAAASDIVTIQLLSSQYYFDDYVEVSTLNQALRITGTSAAPYLSYIHGTLMTGKAGLTTLFLLSASDGAGQAYSLEVDHINFDGGHITTGVVSALKNTSVNAPQRPFNVHHCGFRRFAKAIWSIIDPAGGKTTGICQVNINTNSFHVNTYALYGEGALGSIMNLDFRNNVSEMGGRIYITDSAAGTINISDNLLEGQSDSVYISAGLCSFTMERNYFELNTGYLVKFTATNPLSTFKMGDNYITNCAGTSVLVNNCRAEITDDLEGNSVYLAPTNLNKSSKLLQNVVYLGEAGQTEMSLSVKADLLQGQIDPQVAIPTGVMVKAAASSLLPNHYDLRGSDTITALSPNFQADIGNIAVGDYVCVVLLVSSIDSPYIWLNLYADDNAFIANTNTSFAPHQRYGEWNLLFFAIKATDTSTGHVHTRIACTAAKQVRISDMYVYKVAAAGVTDKLYIYLPKTERADQATILLNGTSIVVTHGMGYIPYNIQAMPTVNVGYVWVDTVGAVQFTINCSSNAHAACPVYWRAS